MTLLLALLLISDLERAVADLKAGRLAEAQAALETIAQREPSSADVLFYLGIARLQSGHPDTAIQPLTRASVLAPGRAALWKALGISHSALGNLTAAEAPFRQACELDSANELACYSYARNLQAQNRFEPAIAAFRRALTHERKQNHWLVRRGLALALEAHADVSAAEREFREAARLMPERVRPEDDPRTDYGAFLFRQGRAQEAVAPLEAAAAAHPASASAHFHLARVLVQLNRLGAAAVHLEAAVKADPKHHAAHLLLGQAYTRLGRKQDGAKHLRIGAAGAAESK
ncbi:MAG TPA: tetratricopeptide repeat protein [Bryobacteraceae bacterium]|nr:tetratricopeptide repeat protein [Bryobacteraceae bacterium]